MNPTQTNPYVILKGEEGMNNRRSPEMAGADKFKDLPEDTLINIVSSLTSSEAAAVGKTVERSFQ